MLIKERNCKSIFLFPKSPDAVNVVIRGKNLVTPDYRLGYLRVGTENILQKQSPEYRTTKWFALEETERYLVMSGDAYNRAVWQFAAADGTIYTDIPTEKKYRIRESRLYGITFPRVRIPEGAVRARVFFAKLGDEETLKLGERLQVEYGLLPTSYEPYQETKLALSRMEGECPVVFYWNRRWYQAVVDKHQKEQMLRGATEADMTAGKIIQSNQAVCLKDTEMSLTAEQSVHLEKNREGALVKPVAAEQQIYYEAQEQISPVMDGIYGVRRSLEDSVPVYERIYDAKGLHFNFRHGTEWMTPYANSFDNIYPWCAMRRCAVSFADGKRRVIYEGEPGYATDGSAGDVMVEIPKHYVRRVVENGYEELAISAKPAEGFQLDPSFTSPDGELDAFYVSAYFATKTGSKMESKKDAQVSIFHTWEAYQELIRANRGFESCDMFAVLTMQRLYLIESALLDSQAAMTGNVHMPYLTKDKQATYYSMTDEESTNTIRVRNTSITNRYWVGDVVAIMNYWGDLLNPEYANRRRVILKKELKEDGLVDITFSGPPVKLVAHETGISTLPPFAGKADDPDYVTGIKVNHFEQYGHQPFCYRGIENLWGGVWIVLSHCYVKNSKLTVEYPDGRVATVGYTLPKQDMELCREQFKQMSNMCVRTMGYDPDNPLIGLPVEIGGDACPSSYYCAPWYNRAQPDTEYIVMFGGAWDNMAYAGVSAFRASYTATRWITFNGIRLMTRVDSADKLQ